MSEKPGDIKIGATATSEPPHFALYTPVAAGLAAFLGSPLAGAVVMAINYRRLSDPRRARSTIVWGVVGTAALFAIGALVPDNWNIPTVAFAAPGVLTIHQLAKQLQGTALASHIAAGGLQASIWGAIGIGVLGLMLIMGAIIGVSVLLVPPQHNGPPGTRYAVNVADEIYYDGQATQADAANLGRALENAHYFNGRGAFATLLIDDRAVHVTFFLSDQGLTRPGIEDDLCSLAAEIPKLRADRPLNVRFANKAREVKHELTEP